MCEQTEIDYLDGEIVWVKLSSCWWPGQVTDPHSLPEDLQKEFYKKSLLAAVKFFQEDTFELVKNYQKIYKYNCTLKEEFIRKGLDKYRNKIKDGETYMDKFPTDVETAEKLTGGDPNILSDDRFNPEEKPDISSLFGEKKIQKKKKSLTRRSDGVESPRKITHPRFLRESNHEVRIRQQPSSLPSTPSDHDSSLYPCHLCNFTCTRVNVIICHLKSHNSGETPSPRKPKVKSHSHSRHSINSTDTPKRKYVRKEKSSVSKSRSSNSESLKRKQMKQSEKVMKKKKTDPELREKLLADWDDESDDDVIELDRTDDSYNVSAMDTTPVDNNESNVENEDVQMEELSESDKDDIFERTEELLKETESFTSMDKLESSLVGINHEKKRVTNSDGIEATSDVVDKGLKSPNTETIGKSKKFTDSSPSSVTEDKKSEPSLTEDDDKKSRLSCFDFDEEDPPERPFPPVRKIPRVFGEKNLSLKKEMIREFELSQALETEKNKTVDKSTTDDDSMNEKSEDEPSANKIDEARSETEIINQEKSKTEEAIVEKHEKSNIAQKKSNSNVTETELEIVEIFEVEKESSDERSPILMNDIETTKSNEMKMLPHEMDETLMEIIGLNRNSLPFKDRKFNEESKIDSNQSIKDLGDTGSEQITTETEDETVSESVDTVVEQSEQSDVDTFDPKPQAELKIPENLQNVEQVVKRKRGRPRKSTDVGKPQTNDDKLRINVKDNSDTSKAIKSDKIHPESETERSSGRKRKPNKKYIESIIHVKDPDEKQSRADESLSSEDDKFPEIMTSKSRRGRRSLEHKQTSNIKTDKNEEHHEELVLKPSDPVEKESIETNSNTKTMELDTLLTLGSCEKLDLEETTSEPIEKPMEDTEPMDTNLTINNIQDTSAKDEVPPMETKDETDKPSDLHSTKPVEMLPPKKSQIKKFELSQIDSMDVSESPEKSIPKTDAEENMNESETLVEKNEETQLVLDNLDPSQMTDFVIETSIVPDKAPLADSVQNIPSNNEETAVGIELCAKDVPENVETMDDSQVLDTKNDTQVMNKEQSNVEIVDIPKKDIISDEKPINTFQEAFLKTLEIDEKITEDKIDDTKIDQEEQSKKPDDHLNILNVEISNETTATTEDVIEQEVETTVLDPVKDIARVEVVVEESEVVKTLQDDTVESIEQLPIHSNKVEIEMKSDNQTLVPEESIKNISLEIQKFDDMSKSSTAALSPNTDVSVPVKKREMPRIIENVTLTEPMQILKTKLLDKIPQKSTKHKLELDYMKKGNEKSSPKAKVMKLDPMSPNSKTTSPNLKLTSPSLSLTQKLQLLKSEEVESKSIVESPSEKIIVQNAPSLNTSVSEKYIQQSSQSLADMDLDINSMPFVLSEDVLTPETIEQIPVVISSIIPASTSMPTTLSFTPVTQIVTTNQAPFKLTNESPTTPKAQSPKKKSGTPAILKSKAKAKPIITSIKTIVPPLTGGVKGLKFQNTPSKVPPLLTQKGLPGKYVVVQTAGGQQLRYSVQSSGKPNAQQKIAIPTGKGTSNAHVVQQGGKVVILTSTQSGQTKMLPLNISKHMGSKVQSITTSKGQVFSSLGSGNLIASKNVIASNIDTTSPTTSKLSPSHKIINTQGIVTSKGVLTPIPGTITKTALLSTLSQGILTKGGIYTPLTTSTLGGKTIISGKTLLTKSGTILSPQNLGTSKAILTPISPTIGGKAILGPSGIIATKGTVLRPITGPQVKAIAAKSPNKAKAQYQMVQQKIQLPALQKTMAKTTPASKTLSSPVVVQNTISPRATAQANRKATPRGKTGSPRGRQPRIQQKILVQQIQQEPGIPAGQNVNLLKHTLTSSTEVPVPHHSILPQKTLLPEISITKLNKPTKAPTINKGNQKEKLLKSTLSSPVVTSDVNKDMSVALSQSSTEIVLETDKKKKVEVILEENKTIAKPEIPVPEPSKEVNEKVDEPKVTTQPQIMALPTESSDGTQTYVLVTIDEQGQIQPLDNNALMSLEGTTQNPDGTRTLYIDPSSLGEAGTLDNIVLQFDNGIVPSASTCTSESTSGFSSSEIVATSNQDILAAALANTDFQQEISLPDNPSVSVMTTGLTQTSLINQTILQSTIIPPTEPISSPSVLETSLTLNQPIMTPLEVPSNVSIQSEQPASSVVSTIPTSLELPITITNPNISYITSGGSSKLSIPGNSMPDIEGIIDNQTTTAVPQTTEIAPANTQYLVIQNLNDNNESQNVESGESAIPTVSYSVSIPSDMVLESTPGQTTPSMPIIDDGFSENTQFVSSVKNKGKNIVAMKDNQLQDIVVTSEVNVGSQEEPVSTNKVEDVPVSSIEITLTSNDNVGEQNEDKKSVQTTSSMPIIDEVTNSTSNNEGEVVISQEAEATEEKFSHMIIEDSLNKDLVIEESTVELNNVLVIPVESQESMDVDETVNKQPSESNFGDSNTEVSQEAPSQSYEQFHLPLVDNSVDLPSQSAMKSENSREPTQSVTYEPMERDEDTVNAEPPTQSFEHSEINEATQSYDITNDTNTNAPTQSFNEVAQNQEDRVSADEEMVDDQSFPTQSYEVEKLDNLSENLETDGELSQEGNIPSQSNDIGTDGIGTSSVSTNNSGLNEDETASSSYVPETPETQERDQDQESAISTSSYEIPPCEELNIGSSSVIPDTSVRAEHTSIHDNGVPEIPTSSYNLNPDITSTHVDSVPTSSYEDQVIVEQNVSTSYEVPISMPGLEETSSHNFVTESTDHRSEPSSYYTHNPEVTASYYESVDQDTNSRTEEDSQGQVTPSYYERNSQEASQSYFPTEEATPSYSPGYYESRPETEASQSYYSTEDIEKTEQSSSQNVEASPSFYQEQSDELRLRQQGEATPTYSGRYPIDYTLENSPIERHDLVESSVSATKPSKR